MRDRPFAKTDTTGSGDLDRVVGEEVALHAHDTRRAAATGCRRRARDVLPRRPRPRPRKRARTRSTACAPAGGARAGAPRCPRPPTPATASSSTPGRSAAAMTARTPDHDAMRAAATLEAIPPLPRCEPAPPICSSKARSMPTTSSMSDAFGVETRIGGEHARRVGEQDEQVGVHEMGDEGRETIVVAEPDLVVGDGVVLVDDGHGAELEQPRERLAGVEVLAALDEVVRNEQHLRGHQPVRREDVVVGAHQAALPGRGERLQRGRVGRTLLQPERRRLPRTPRRSSRRRRRGRRRAAAPPRHRASRWLRCR